LDTGDTNIRKSVSVDHFMKMHPLGNRSGHFLITNCEMEIKLAKIGGGNNPIIIFAGFLRSLDTGKSFTNCGDLVVDQGISRKIR
jgi:hypothetical protein